MCSASTSDLCDLKTFLGSACMCHTRLSEGNQVQTYMHARIKFHAYSDK
jgi:hypothetical protein